VEAKFGSEMDSNELNVPSQKAIGIRAERLWCDSGCLPGGDEENWAVGATELKREFRPAPSQAKEVETFQSPASFTDWIEWCQFSTSG
jgi:hypothetical protein